MEGPLRQAGASVLFPDVSYSEPSRSDPFEPAIGRFVFRVLRRMTLWVPGWCKEARSWLTNRGP